MHSHSNNNKIHNIDSKENMDSLTNIQIKDGNDLFTLIGDGKYQLLILILGLIATVPCATQEFLLNFVALDGGWECVPNSTVCKLIGRRSAEDIARCSMNRTEWKYHGTKTFSIVNEFELFCQRDYWVPLSTALFYIANLIGAPILGMVIDRYSRTRTVFTCITVVLLTCFSAAFVQSLWLFQVLRFINGFFMPGTYFGMIIINSEIVSEKYRNSVVNAYLAAYPLGVSLFGLVSYLVQDWRKMMIYTSAPYFVVLVFYWFVPEPFLWLYDNGHHEKLREQLKRICRMNKVQVPTADITFLKTSMHYNADKKKNVASGFLELFRPINRLFMTLSFFVAFTAQGVLYYGIELIADNLTGNLYRDFILLIMVELISTLIALVTSDRFGRKSPTIGSYLIGGMSMIAISMVPVGKISTSAIRLTLALTTKILTSAAYIILILWTVELYPTKLRAKANGALNCVYCFGGVIAPWVGIWLHKLQRNAPFFVMGGLIVISAVLLFNVPETKGKGLAGDDGEDEGVGINGIEMASQGMHNIRENNKELSEEC